MGHSSSSTQRPILETEAPEGASIAAVGDLLSALNLALKSLRFYGAENPSSKRALEAVRGAFEVVWKYMEEMELFVHEGSLVYQNEIVYRQESRNESLAFKLYNDGIRELVFFPGFESEELEQFLGVIVKIYSVHNEADDLVTLLWEKDLSFVRYGYVDVTTDEAPLPVFSLDNPEDFARALVLEMGGRVDSSQEPADVEDSVAVEGGEAAPPGATQVPEKPQNAPVRSSAPVLDADEMRYLEQEIEKELARDVCADVVNALLDSLDDPKTRNPSEVIEILGELIPSLVEHGRVRLAGDLLAELRQTVATSRVLDSKLRNELSHILSVVGSSPAVESFLKALAAGELTPDIVDLEEFFLYLGPSALESMARAADQTRRNEIRSVIQDAVWLLMLKHPSTVVELLRSEDVAVVRETLRVVPKLNRHEATSEAIALLKHKESKVRLASLEALMTGGEKAALEAIVGVLLDEAPAVRIAAAWGLGTWQYAPAVSQLQAILEGRSIREAHVTEKIAIFEAYARIGKAAALPLLDRILNKRKLLGKRESSDLRACAARALTLIQVPEAQGILQKAAEDKDSIVRRTVLRGLKKPK